MLFLQGEARLTKLFIDGLGPLLIPTDGCLPLVALCLHSSVLLPLLLDEVLQYLVGLEHLVMLLLERCHHVLRLVQLGLGVDHLLLRLLSLCLGVGYLGARVFDLLL